MRTPDSLATSRITACPAVSPTSIRPPGRSQFPPSTRRTTSTWPAPLRTAANAAGSVVRAGGVDAELEKIKIQHGGNDATIARHGGTVGQYLDDGLSV